MSITFGQLKMWKEKGFLEEGSRRIHVVVGSELGFFMRGHKMCGKLVGFASYMDGVRYSDAISINMLKAMNTGDYEKYHICRECVSSWPRFELAIRKRWEALRAAGHIIKNAAGEEIGISGPVDRKENERFYGMYNCEWL